MVIFPKPIQCSFGKKVIENKVCRGKTKVLTCKISCCLNSESFFWVSLSSFLFFPEALKLHGVWISLLLSMHPTVSVRNFLCLKIWFTPAVSFASKSVQLHFTHANHKAVKTLSSLTVIMIMWLCRGIWWIFAIYSISCLWTTLPESLYIHCLMMCTEKKVEAVISSFFLFSVCVWINNHIPCFIMSLMVIMQDLGTVMPLTWKKPFFYTWHDCPWAFSIWNC